MCATSIPLKLRIGLVYKITPLTDADKKFSAIVTIATTTMVKTALMSRLIVPSLVLLLSTINVFRNDYVNTDTDANAITVRRKKRAQLDLKSALEGGVLPIRRFRINNATGNILLSLQVGDESAPIINNYDTNTTATSRHTRALLHHLEQHNMTLVRECNMACLHEPSCDAWELIAAERICTLFRHRSGPNDRKRCLEAIPADNNDPNYVVGFLQRNATILRRKEETQDISIQDRVLYILHSHHDLKNYILERILTLLDTYMPYDKFDVVVITPNIMNVSPGSAGNGTSLLNPFFTRDPRSKRGATSYLSLALAFTKFPGYKGYLLANDDASLRLWDLVPNGWFEHRSWGTIWKGAIRDERQRIGIKRRTRRRHPFGPYVEWYWWNLDSGSTAGPPRRYTRANFEAFLAALNEFCDRPEYHGMLPDDTEKRWFCDDRRNDTVRPYMSAKGDVFYVANNEVGRNIVDTLVLFGEHDVFLEVAVPAAYVMVIPKEEWLPVPYCEVVYHHGEQTLMEKGPNNMTFVPPYIVNASESGGLNCSVIHPLKFSKESSVDYWRRVVETECPSCRSEREGNVWWSRVEDSDNSRKSVRKVL